MITSMRFLCACVFACWLIVAAGVEAQPFKLPKPPTPSEKPPQMEDIQGALAGISAYPEDTLLSILTLCQKPKLIQEMASTGKLPKQLALQTPSIQKAAIELIRYPDIIKILNENIEIATIVGRVYAEAGPEIRKLVSQLAAQSQQQELQQKEEWLELLKGNQKAIEELADAVQALADEEDEEEEGDDKKDDGDDKKDDGDDDDGGDDNNDGGGDNNDGDNNDDGDDGDGGDEGASDDGYGVSVDEDGAVSVSGSPSQEVVDYLVANADQYPNAATEALKYCQKFPVGNESSAMLKELQGLAGMQDLTKNPALLKETAKLRKEFPGDKGGLTKNADRIRGIAGRRGEYPELSKRTEGFAKRNPQHKMSKWQRTPNSLTRQPLKQSKVRTPRQGRKGPASLRSAKPSKRQRISSAGKRHNNSWQKMGKGRKGSPSRRGGGGSRRGGGGSRRGGGGSRRGGGGPPRR
jgi:hypothetical protein